MNAERPFHFDIELRGQPARVEGFFAGNGPEDPCEFDIDAVWLGWSDANRGMPEHAGGPNPLDLSSLTEEEEQAIDDAAWSAVAALNLCSDCPPEGWATDATRCADCPRTGAK